MFWHCLAGTLYQCALNWKYTNYSFCKEVVSVRPNLKWTRLPLIWVDRQLQPVNQQDLVSPHINGKHSTRWHLRKTTEPDAPDERCEWITLYDCTEWWYSQLSVMPAAIAAHCRFARVRRVSLWFTAVPSPAHLHFSQRCHCLIYSAPARR